MKTIKLIAKDVQEALRGFSKMGLRKGAPPVLRSVRVRARGGVATLAATDLDQMLEYTTTCDPAADGQCRVPLDTLQGACRKIPGSARLSIDATGNAGSIHVDDGKVATTVVFEPMDLGSFPTRSDDMARVCALPSMALEALAQAGQRASTDPSRAILNGVMLDGENVVATDGRQLYRSNSLKLEIDAPLVVPTSKVFGVFDTASGATLMAGGKCPGGKMHGIAQNRWLWVFEPLQGTYPNWRQVLPKEGDVNAAVRLSDADVTVLQRLAGLPFTREKDAPVSVSVTDAAVTLHVGVGKDRQDHPLAPEKVTGEGNCRVAFNFNYLLTAVKDGLRTVLIKDELSPVLVREGPRQVLFMPLRMAAESERRATEPPAKTMVSTPAAAPAPVSPTTRTEETTTMDTKDSVKKSTPVGADNRNAAEPPALVRLVDQASALRDSLRKAANELGSLVQLSREAGREQAALEKEFSQLRRNIRSLQKIEV